MQYALQWACIIATCNMKKYNLQYAMCTAVGVYKCNMQNIIVMCNVVGVWRAKGHLIVHLPTLTAPADPVAL